MNQLNDLNCRLLTKYVFVVKSLRNDLRSHTLSLSTLISSLYHSPLFLSLQFSCSISDMFYWMSLMFALRFLSLSPSLLNALSCWLVGWVSVAVDTFPCVKTFLRGVSFSLSLSLSLFVCRSISLSVYVGAYVCPSMRMVSDGLSLSLSVS